MFEFFIALKYLIPRKKALSTALISLMSVFVISLVVWLVLVFLSVTTGIEKKWIKKLTSLNAPLRISPNQNYFSSYYYLIDSISSKSNYSNKSIEEKLTSSSNPYTNEVDMEIPYYWPKPNLKSDGSTLDLVKETYAILEKEKQKNPSLKFQDFEVGGALMRLSLYRSAKSDNSSLFEDEKVSFLSQMSYLLSLCDKNPNLPSLYLKPSSEDLNNVLIRLEKSYESIQKDTPFIQEDMAKNDYFKQLKRFFDNVTIKKLISEKEFVFPINLLSEDKMEAFGLLENGKIKKLILLQEPAQKYLGLEKGIISFKNNSFVFKTKTSEYPVTADFFICDKPLIFDSVLNEGSLASASYAKEIFFNVKTSIQGKTISGKIPYAGVKIFDFDIKTSFKEKPLNEPLWFYEINNKVVLPDIGVLLPKSLKDSGVLIGDKGYFSFAAKTATATQEQRLMFYVAGFYDPGILPIGNRCIIVPKNVTKTLFATNSLLTPEGIPTNGIFIWTDLNKIEEMKTNLEKEFLKNGLAPYFSIQTYKEFEFSKDLMEQFQSDRLLFTLIAVIIIIVACSNIISLLVLLVNDKKKEIAVLQAMGASKKSIALIFGFCGTIMGILSSLIGTLAAIFTLHNLDALVNFLSFIQGHAAFNAAFFGEKLPNTLSLDALKFILIATPIISLAAGLIPALKASRMQPSQILRAD